jgi:environmental stress-induced protein Ves
MGLGQAARRKTQETTPMQTLKADTLIDVPWKNGGGITRNVAKGLRLDHPAWTISRADVSRDGPFSDFSGMMRVLTVVSGGPMVLGTPTTSMTANLWDPVRFDGNLKIQSRLIDGPLTDLNLMFDPKYCEGHVVPHEGPLERRIEAPEQGLLAFHILAGTPSINDTRLGVAETAFILKANAVLKLAKGDALLEIRLTYLDQSEAIKLCIADR